MLAPMLQAAGFAVSAVGTAREALGADQGGRTLRGHRHRYRNAGDWTASQFAETVRADPHTAGLPVIGLSPVVSAEAIERGRRAGFHDCVAKFDRQGLIAALKEQTDVGCAA